LNVLVKHLAPHDVKNLTAEFEKLDVQQNGYLLFEDLERAVKNSGFKTSKSEID
jgi:Ca2+-binding EF-hand superfamily protein